MARSAIALPCGKPSGAAKTPRILMPLTVSAISTAVAGCEFSDPCVITGSLTRSAWGSLGLWLGPASDDRASISSSADCATAELSEKSEPIAGMPSRPKPNKREGSLAGLSAASPTLLSLTTFVRSCDDSEGRISPPVYCGSQLLRLLISDPLGVQL